MVETIASGFENEAVQSSHFFRTLLQAMSRPATIQPLGIDIDAVGCLNRGAALVALTLADHESPVWLDEELSAPAVKEFIRFHCSAPILAEPGKAMFGFFAKSPDFEQIPKFSVGTADYPDRSVTLVIQVASLSQSGGMVFCGPGIKNTQSLSVEGLHESFWPWLKSNRETFPLGIDVILATDEAVASLPRTISVKEAG